MTGNVLVTGASGFVGRRLVARLASDGRNVRAAFRALPSGTKTHPGVPDESVVTGNLNGSTDWAAALKNVGTVVHLAARVHIMNETSSDPLEEFRAVNVEGTLNLARQAVAAGARRFIFISSIKVNGEATHPGKPFFADDAPAPTDPYGTSKLEAETGLLSLSRSTGLEVVIIRPVLVYGPGVAANFLSMMRWLKKGIPLPFGSIDNRRSMVAVDNLVDLISICIDHRAAANQTFLVSDDEDLSTSQLLERTAQSLGKTALLLPVPAGLLSGCATLLGKGALAQRLCGSLQVDIRKTRELLGWTPPVTVEQGLALTAEYFLDHAA